MSGDRRTETGDRRRETGIVFGGQWLAFIVYVLVLVMPAELWGQPDTTKSVQGLSGGIVVSSFTGIELDASATPGFSMGIYSYQPFSGRWGILTEVYYVQKGMEVRRQDNDFTLQIDYVEIPITAQYRVPLKNSHLKFIGGGYLGIILNGYSSLQILDSQVITPDDWIDSLNEVDGGLVVGTGFDFPMGGRSYGLMLRYTRGLSKTFNKPAPTSLSNQTVSLLLSISF